MKEYPPSIYVPWHKLRKSKINRKSFAKKIENNKVENKHRFLAVFLLPIGHN